MDILSISQLAGLNSDQWSSGSASQRNERTAEGDTKDRGQEQSKALKPEELYDTARLRSDTLYGYHGLNLNEAQTVLASVAPQIADLSPFGAADLQKVTASKLLPSAYV